MLSKGKGGKAASIHCIFDSRSGGFHAYTLFIQPVPLIAYNHLCKLKSGYRKRMLHLQGKNCQPSSTRMERSTSDFISFFRMRPVSFRFTNFRRASSRQSTRQTSLRTTRDFVTSQSSKSNSLMRIRWNGSPAWSTATTTDGSQGKLIVDFRNHIRNCWRCSRIEFFGLHYKKFTYKG